MNNKSSKLKILIIDDELSGRTMIEYYIEQFLNDLVDKVVKVSSIDEAKEAMLSLSPNIVFTDYELSGEDGLKIAPFLSKECILVVVTAHSQYAINAIRANVFDYLLKPIDEAEFIKFKARLLLKMNLQIGANLSVDTSESFVIKEKGGNILIPFEDIIFIEASGAYSKVVTLNRKYVATKTLKALEETILPKSFLRVHRSFLVPRWQITSFSSNYLCLKDGTHINLSKTGRKILQDSF
jgi:two-component system, LytTR family, response regulator